MSFILYILIVCRNKFVDGGKMYEGIKNKQRPFEGGPLNKHTRNQSYSE